MTECIYQISENDKFHKLCGRSCKDESLIYVKLCVVKIHCTVTAAGSVIGNLF